MLMDEELLLCDIDIDTCKAGHFVGYVPHSIASDPPDELIPKPAAEPTVTTYGSVSVLGHTVTVVYGKTGCRIRTALAVLCAVAVSLVNDKVASPISCIVPLLLADVCVFVLLTVFSGRSQVSPLGKLAVVKLTLMYVHPTLAVVFEKAFLVLCLVGSMLRDLCIMMFCTVICVATMTLIR